MVWPGVPWSTGTIKAVGMKGGVQVAVDSINTASTAAKVALKADKTTLNADGEDVSNIEVSLADAADNFIFSATDTVQFTLTGAGRSLGIASGDWSSAEPFKATSRKLYHGKVLIVIQSTMTPGTIVLTVNSGALPPATLTITTTVAGGPGGNSGTGGSGGAGDTIGSGGVTGTGGTTSSGGAAGTGASVGSGGISRSGGVTGTGGTIGPSGGGGAGGAGGAAGAGGATGGSGSGGRDAAIGSGGASSTGAASGGGGASGQGGIPGIGGNSASGGIVGTGGAAVGNQGGSSVQTGQSGTRSSGCSCNIDSPNHDYGSGLLLQGVFAVASAFIHRQRNCPRRNRAKG